jgi:MFS family permease
MIAALSVGAAGLGATLGAILTGFLNLKWMMPIGVVGIILIISGPSMILAWLKLRRRNLGPILDANGWAVNAKAKINVPFGASLTQVASLPPNALRDRARDPFAEKKRPWKLYTVLVLVLVLGLLWGFGKLDSLLPDAIKSDRVLHRQSAKPAAQAPVAAEAPAPAPAQSSAPAPAAGSK